MNILWKRISDLVVTKAIQLGALAFIKGSPNASLQLKPGDTFGNGPAGGIRLNGMVFQKQAAPIAKTVAATLTPAEILNGLITANQGGAAAMTYTMPTGTLLQNALPPDFAVDDSFDFAIVNISTVAAEDLTVAGGVGTTAVGNMTIASNAAVADQAWGTFRVRKTGDNAFSFYRIG